MIFAVTGVTFMAIVVVVLGLVYAFSTSGAIAERLSRLWHPPAVAPETTFRVKQKERAQRVLSDIGKLIPASTKTLPRSRRMMIRAGYRRPEAIQILRGAKAILILGLLSAVYFTDLYRQNQFILVFAVLLGFMLPDFWLSRRVRRRQHRIRLAMPDAMDLLVVCVEAGLGLDQAILRVAQELRIAHPILSEELQLLIMEMRVGKSRIDAWHELASRTGVDDIKTLVSMLVQTERFGTSVAQSLRVHSDNLRTKRRQRAEEQAAKTSVKMVPVLVFFIFPALLLVILGPAVITMVRQMLPLLAS